MGNYDEVLQMAMHLKFGTPEQKLVIVETIENLDSEGIENILEECREIMFDNIGDEQVTKSTCYLVQFIQTNMTTRIINKAFLKITNIFKK